MPLRLLYPEEPSIEGHATKVDVIAIHGLNPRNLSAHRHAWSTWTTKVGDTERLWLRDDLPSYIPNARIFLYEFDSTVVYGKDQGTFVDKANELLESIRIERDEDDNRPIILMGHSLGGLLIEQALVNAHANPRLRSVKEATNGIAFFGTPHTGGDDKLVLLGDIAANIALKLGFQRGNNIIETLKTGSLFSDLLRDQWRHQLLEYNIVSFWGAYDKVVPRESSKIGLPGDRENVVKLNADHNEERILDYRKTTSSHVASDLPPRNARFFGRKSILKQMQEFVESQDGAEPSTLTLQGIGGVGKTSVALEFAHTTKTFDIVLWIQGDTSISLAQSFTKAAGLLNVPGFAPNSYVDNRLALLNWLRKTSKHFGPSLYLQKLTFPGSKWLLIFDNAEDPETLGLFWPERGHGAIIVTTRKPNLAYAMTKHEIVVERFSANEGTQFFVDLATWNSNATKDFKSAALINEQLDGHALGISQMAAIVRSRRMSIEDFATIYAGRGKRWHEVVSTGGHHVNYDKTLATVWEMSFQALEESSSASSLLGILSFLWAPSIPQALSKHWGECRSRATHSLLPFCQEFDEFLDVEEKLLELALIQKAPESGSISLHRLVQTEFEYHLSVEERRQSFINTSKLLFDVFPRSYTGQRVLDNWDTCQLYIPHVIRLNEHYLKQDKNLSKYQPCAEFVKLMAFGAWYLFELANYDQLMKVLRGGMQACRELFGKSVEQEEDYAFLCHISGTADNSKGNFDSAEFFLLKGLDIRRRLEPPNLINIATSLNNLGVLHNSKRQFFRARECLNECIQITKQRIPSQDRDIFLKMAEHNLARNALHSGDAALAKPLLEEQLDFYEKTKSWWMITHVHFILGNLYLAEGDLISSVGHFSKARTTLNDAKAGTQNTMAMILYKLGFLSLKLGDPSKAIELLRESLSISALHSLIPCEKARTLFMLSEALCAQGIPGSPKRSRDVAEEAQKIVIEFYHGLSMNQPEGSQNEAWYNKSIIAWHW
ncbi:Tetratricopeptide-like helical [Penicillium italicum]|uniref:Tetratricopeptide-like helical n=1 Tax=Penicillium italicum TaxID=40296 RepID=A0A0A2L0X3_PENIT|nr:Tetratricopeptide-like helical [Penicillium italicum]